MKYPRIRALREDKDLKQRELADFLHCSQVSYSYYELGSRDIPTEILILLAKFHYISTTIKILFKSIFPLIFYCYMQTSYTKCKP